jgi:hypothetical protein
MSAVITSIWKLQSIAASILSTYHPPSKMFPAWKQWARMHVVSRAPLDTAARKFPNQAQALDDLYRVLKKGTLPFTRRHAKALSLPGQDEIPGKMVGH